MLTAANNTLTETESENAESNVERSEEFHVGKGQFYSLRLVVKYQCEQMLHRLNIILRGIGTLSSQYDATCQGIS